MLTPEKLYQIEELNNDEVTYSEYYQEASTASRFFWLVICPYFFVYFFLFKYLKWILLAKIIMGLFTVVFILLSILLPVAIYQICCIRYKNKYLNYIKVIHLILYSLDTLCVVFYFTKVILNV